MTRLNKRWQIAPKLSPAAEQELHGYPPLLQQILYNRGYATREEARLFLEAHPTDKSHISYPLGVKEAAKRIDAALNANEIIAIYGDYDADGVTGTAMLTSAIRSLGGTVIPYIPDRVAEGYGLNHKAIEELHAQGVGLVISVDCGIRALGEVQTGKALGMDFILTDHHHPGPQLPAADVIINPKREDDPYPEKDLAGVGVAYKLLVGLSETHPHFQADDYLDLVAVGTVADLVPLTGENRILVRRGLQQMTNPHRQGLMSLMGVAGVKPDNLTATHIGFQIGPRINAAGRMSSASTALELLLEKNIQRTGPLAQELEILNRKRRKITQEIREQANKMITAKGEVAPIICAFHPDFHQGVVGLAASSLVEQYYRPAIVGEQKEEFTTASCRSIAEFNIIEALDKCEDLLEQHGGHAAAAGFTISNANIPAFIDRMTQIARQEFDVTQLRPTLYADAVVQIADLNSELMGYLGWLQPTGYGNPQAKFVCYGVKVASSRVVGKNGEHLKLKVTDGRFTIDAIAFRQGAWIGKLPSEVNLLFTFEENEFRGRKTLQLNIADIKAS
ncbi:MAG: single-stranded-DNA-specific exonuclease RecJ [Chloroflexota bacterium]|nr:MAG: single-stranded-DNA-specific exonuclease RecJ [Anaerolineaceae bacterium 4572_5.2]RLD09250.1 MAG: single-stranded-DNA-specific exonuclease RecJ [Chloroflexota bacterium]